MDIRLIFVHDIGFMLRCQNKYIKLDLWAKDESMKFKLRDLFRNCHLKCNFFVKLGKNKENFI